MNNTKLAETVLFVLEGFFLLQEIDHHIKENDSDVIDMVRSIYKGPSDPMSLYPFMRLNTVLAILYIPISFAKDLDEFKIKDCYDTEFKDLKNPEKTKNLKPYDFLKAFRDSVAHMADENNLIQFDGEDFILRCTSGHDRYQLDFRSEEGFICFLRDLIPLIKKKCNRLVPEKATGASYSSI